MSAILEEHRTTFDSDPSNRRAFDALEEHLFPGETIIIRGEPDAAGRWQKAATLVYAPKRQVYLLAGSDEELPDALADKRTGAGTIAYLCQGQVCSEPLMTMEAMLEVIAK